jgi:hypothetical protein
VTLQPRPQRYEIVCEKERKILGFGFHDCHDYRVVLARSSGEHHPRQMPEIRRKDSRYWGTQIRQIGVIRGDSTDSDETLRAQSAEKVRTVFE